MPNIPYCSMHLPTGWIGLSMPTEGFSVHMPFVITTFKVRGIKHDSVPYMMMIILIHILLSVGLLTLMNIDSLIVLARPRYMHRTIGYIGHAHTSENAHRTS